VYHYTKVQLQKQYSVPFYCSHAVIDITLKNKIIIDKQFQAEFFEIFVDYYKLYLTEGFLLPSRFKKDTNTFIKNIK
jgi:hypothetical protein